MEVYIGIECRGGQSWWETIGWEPANGSGRKRRSTIILHGSITQKTALNIILAAVRTWNLTRWCIVKMTYFLDIMNHHSPNKNTTFGRLESVSVVKWYQLWWAQWIHLVPISFQQSRFCLSTETESSLRNVVLLIKLDRWTMSRKCDFFSKNAFQSFVYSENYYFCSTIMNLFTP
jgi:hypothetical protein